MENPLLVKNRAPLISRTNQIESEQFRSEGQKKPSTIWKMKSPCEFANLYEFNPPEIIKFANSQIRQLILKKCPSLPMRKRFTTSSRIGQLQIKVVDLADIWRGPAADDKKQEG
jgi:hypothetical protein